MMHYVNALATIDWQPAVLSLLAVAGLLGLLALVSPRGFRALATFSATWVDSAKLVNVLDKRIDIDQYFLERSRVLGTLVVASAATAAFVIVVG